MGEFCQALQSEMHLRKDYLQEPVDTIYFGGGTPSRMPMAELRACLAELAAHYVISGNAEVSLEANPEDLDEESLLELKDMGFNRLSIGIQSFDPRTLKVLNRAHDAEQATNAVQLAQQAGFVNISIDLIFGLPGQDPANWEQQLDKAIALNPAHISAYSLSVEENTRLAKDLRLVKLCVPDESSYRAQYEMLLDRMDSAGFEAYEISNFARPGYRSRHNSAYWNGTPYMGLGPSAHSFNGRERCWNISNTFQYIKAIGQSGIPQECETLDRNTRVNEYLMTRLRTADGLDLNAYETAFGADEKTRLLHASGSSEFFESDGRNLRLSRPGRFISDELIADLFLV